MSQATQPSGNNQRGVTPRPGHITKVPTEIIVEIFKFAVFSSEEARSHGVKALCLVSQYWNQIANGTPHLWTKVTLSYPLHADQLSAAWKWLRASEEKALDIEIDLRDPAWVEFGKELYHPLRDSAKLLYAIALLRGSEHRWRSISFKLNVLGPIYKFLQAWEIPSLPLLESISFEEDSGDLENGYTRFDPRESFELPTVFCSAGTLMPALRGISLSAVNVNWVSAAASFQNLRELRIRKLDYEACPTFNQFAALLAASPRLETLDVTGYCPNPPTGTGVPLVYLPTLKNLVFGWTDVGPALTFLETFQIPESLETLSLIDAVAGLFGYSDDSSLIFDLLAHLGQSDPGSGNHQAGKDRPRDRDHSTPWVSMLGLKSLSVSWVESSHDSIARFLERAPAVEEICLADVGQGVLQGIASFVETRRPSCLKKINLQRSWSGGGESFEAHHADILRDHKIEVIENPIEDRLRWK